MPISPSRSAALALRQRLVACSVGLALALAGLAAGAAAKPKPPPYDYFVTGDPQQPATVRPPLQPSFVLMGGGPDVDEAFRWMIGRAGIQPGSGGRFVVIRATGSDAYDPYIYYSDADGGTSPAISADWVGGRSLGLGSVETLVIPSVAAANDRFVNAVVGNAHAIFIAGGDQSDYIRYWKGTELDRTLQRLIAANVPIGGTSAGLAVLGQVDFAALKGSVTSVQALANPYDHRVTLDPDPLGPTGGFLAPRPLANIVFDSHLDSRDRMGRMIAFVARMVARQRQAGCDGGFLAAGSDPDRSARAIGIDVETALLVEGRPGAAVARRITNPTTTSESAVYFVRPLLAAADCRPGKPLTISNVEIRKLGDSNRRFDLSSWSGIDVTSVVDVDRGALTSDPY